MKFQDKINTWLNSHKFHYWIMLSLIGVVYTTQTWIYSQYQKSLLDEGNYLLKGYLFATGKYIPFQDYGTWTNKMPLSFLVPGYIQKLFGPGLSTGRYYAFCISILILITAVIIGYRLGKKTGSLLTGVMLVVNPAPLKIFSQVLTQGIVTLLLLF